MALRVAALWIACVLIVLLAGGCGPDEPPVGEQAAGGGPSATGGNDKASDLSPVCARLARQVQATYTIRSRSTPAGREVWVTLTIRNDMSRSWLFAIFGVAGVTDYNPGSVPLLNWGGSSSDYKHVPARSEQTYRVASADPSRLSIPADAKFVGLQGSVFVEGDGCDVPARGTAPSNLVEGHPDGVWELATGWPAAHRAERIIVRKVCGPPDGTSPPSC